MPSSISLFVLALCGSIAGCARPAPAENAPPRSPTTDYPHPAARSADGQVLGADGTPPEDRLRAGPTLGSGGLTPAERPGGAEPQAEPCKDGVTPAGKPCKPAGKPK
ncbi:MAG: hypothetical protein IT374_11795 [Polyangiaceae bacterium]|nr:hypothetical protein [Polyangiaceae bacterium]